MPTFSFSLPDEAATERLGAALARRLRPRDVVALQGGLGVGKTTLARAILRAASGDPGLIVPSPTFTLVEVYDTPRGAFWHFDLYRLEAPEQVFELGWEEARADGIALVEWAERLGALLPHERLTVTLAMEGDGGAPTAGRRTVWRSLNGTGCVQISSPRRLGRRRRAAAGGRRLVPQVLPAEPAARFGRGHGRAAAAGGRAALRAHRPAPDRAWPQRAGDPAVDEANGFLLLEDLGDDTFARVLAAGGDEAELYARATDVLVVLHRRPPTRCCRGSAPMPARR